jgi:hypothetical protein
MNLNAWLGLVVDLLKAVEDSAKEFLDPGTPGTADQLLVDLHKAFSDLPITDVEATLVATEVHDFIVLVSGGSTAVADAQAHIEAFATSKGHPLPPIAKGLLSGILAQLEMMAQEYRLGKR